VLNHYWTTFKTDEARAQYEKKYRQYWSLPQPRITDVTMQMDIYPEKRSLSINGTMWLENKTTSDIDRNRGSPQYQAMNLLRAYS